MTSKFKQRLKRLHDSRKRTSEMGEAPQGVYVADGPTASPEKTAPPKTKRSPPDEKPASGWEELGALPISNVRGQALLVSEAFGADVRHGKWQLSACYQAEALEIARLARKRALIDLRPEEQVYLDIETTGLEYGTFAFCVGLGRWVGTSFVVEQYLTQDPRDEAAMLFAVSEVLREARLLVTFNGKRFDVDRLIARYQRNELPSPFDRLAHIDLLPLSRRLIPGQKRYRLSSLEENVLGFFRKDDVPGKDIPPLWKRYLKSGDASLLDGVLEHNRWDIVSMTALLATLVQNKAPATQVGPSPAKEEISRVGARLARSYALKDRSGADRTGADRTGARHPDKSLVSKPNGLSLGDYLKNLREQSEACIREGGIVEALPLLHEMVALAPHHPYALEYLVRHHRGRGESNLVELYEARLKRGSPF